MTVHEFLSTVCHTGEYNWAAAAAAEATVEEDEALALLLLQANRVSLTPVYGKTATVLFNDCNNTCIEFQ